jgi:hypothetical protein
MLSSLVQPFEAGGQVPPAEPTVTTPFFTPTAIDEGSQLEEPGTLETMWMIEPSSEALALP